MTVLKRLKSRERKVYQQARKMIDRVAENPRTMGEPLLERWAGARAVHFADDKYRLIWELDAARNQVVVLLVGPKKDPHGTIYDRPRPN